MGVLVENEAFGRQVTQQWMELIHQGLVQRIRP